MKDVQYEPEKLGTFYKKKIVFIRSQKKLWNFISPPNISPQGSKNCFSNHMMSILTGMDEGYLCTGHTTLIKSHPFLRDPQRLSLIIVYKAFYSHETDDFGGTNAWSLLFWEDCTSVAVSVFFWLTIV